MQDRKICITRGRVGNFNPRVPLNTEPILERVPLEVRDQNFAGATYRKLKFCGCLAPVAPVLTQPLTLMIGLQTFINIYDQNDSD